MTFELEYKPEAQKALDRMEAYWHSEILDRPVINLRARKPSIRPYPKKKFTTIKERWMDMEYQLEVALWQQEHTVCYGEAIPYYFPNLGPEILTAALGADLVFSNDTSWSVPILKDWADIPKLKIDPNNVYVAWILEITRRALELGKGKFLVGITDIHPGADLAASLRNPQQFCIDVVDSPEEVIALMDHIRPMFYEFYNLQRNIMLEAGQTLTTSWLPEYTDGKFYIPSNDFSAMISAKMNSQFFLQEIVEEVEWLDRSIYHLDGPQALRHLDDALAIKKLNGIQYVCGAASEPASLHMEVFRKIQKAGKLIHVDISPDQVDAFIDGLNPEGVMLNLWAESIEEAEAIMSRISRWKRH